MKSTNSRLGILLSAVLVVSGCASVPPEEELSLSEQQVYDPIESFNRSMWTINYDYLDPYFVRPVSLAYVNYVPVPIRSGISNFLGNLDEPSSMINNLLWEMVARL